MVRTKEAAGNTSPMRRRMAVATAGVLAGGLVAFAAHAATQQVIGVGAMEYSDAVAGPATVLMRTLAIAPGEVLGWHHHPGVGAYTIVVSGTLVVEDGCGGETTYSQGEAFLEPAGRVHRGKNLTDADVVTAQTFIVPAGAPTSVSHAQRMCGVPRSVDECKNDGWRRFDLPRYFISQGACMEYVITGV